MGVAPIARPEPPRFDRSLTIGGLPGTGTTTACSRLQALTSLRYVYAGQIFRDMAKQHGMTLEQFGRHCETHPELDRKLDDYQIEVLREGPLLLEGRLAGYLAHRETIPAYKVWFTCDPWVRAERIVGREGGEVESRMEEMRRREESEKKRYWDFYRYDVSDLTVYDLVLDTTHLSKEAVVDQVIDGYHASPLRAKKWYRPWR